MKVFENNEYIVKKFTGRDIVNATLALMSWVARTGVAARAGRPSSVEAAKALVVLVDYTQVDKFCEKPKHNKYDT